VESLDGESLGQATPLDLIANSHRRRHQSVVTDVDPDQRPTSELNAVDQAHQDYVNQFTLKPSEEEQ